MFNRLNRKSKIHIKKRYFSNIKNYIEIYIKSSKHKFKIKFLFITFIKIL